MKELDLVILTESIPETALKKGDVGTIVAIYGVDQGYEVEFTTYTGETVAVVAVKPRQIRKIREKELMSARSLGE